VVGALDGAVDVRVDDGAAIGAAVGGVTKLEAGVEGTGAEAEGGAGAGVSGAVEQATSTDSARAIPAGANKRRLGRTARRE